MSFCGHVVGALLIGVRQPNRYGVRFESFYEINVLEPKAPSPTVLRVQLPKLD